jgi:K+-sensing histidine kinase KdpD
MLSVVPSEDDVSLAPPWLKYTLAVVLAGLALLLLAALPWTVPKAGILLINLLAVMISAYMGGFGPGLLTMAISALGTCYFLLPPLYSLHITARSDLIFLGIFATAAYAASWFLDWANAPRDS